MKDRITRYIIPQEQCIRNELHIQVLLTNGVALGLACGLTYSPSTKHVHLFDAVECLNKARQVSQLLDITSGKRGL